jgi:hypothetical protein
MSLRRVFMDMKRVGSVSLAFIIGVLLIAAPAHAFVGAGITLGKALGDTIVFDLGTGVNALGTGFGLADMNIAVDWGIDYNIASMAGYPYGFGGIGAVTAADVGYNVGLTVDEAYGAGFNGANFGVPLAEQTLSTTHFGQSFANRNKILDTKVMLPFSGFPVL